MSLPRKRHTKLDLCDYERARRAWKQDWEQLELDLQQSIRYFRRKHGRPPLNP